MSAIQSQKMSAAGAVQRGKTVYTYGDGGYVVKDGPDDCRWTKYRADGTVDFYSDYCAAGTWDTEEDVDTEIHVDTNGAFAADDGQAFTQVLEPPTSIWPGWTLSGSRVQHSHGNAILTSGDVWFSPSLQYISYGTLLVHQGQKLLASVVVKLGTDLFNQLIKGAVRKFGVGIRITYKGRGAQWEDTEHGLSLEAPHPPGEGCGWLWIDCWKWWN